MKKIVLTASLIVGIIAFLNYQRIINLASPAHDDKEIHLHAGFLVYKDNTLRDFSAFEFQNFVPCSEDAHDETDDPAHEQLEKAHLHDSVGDVVHVHRSNAVWGDLFKNINVSLDATATAYLNGEILEDFRNYPIKPYESIVIFEGNNDNIETKLKEAIGRDHIEKVELKSENCGV